MTTSPRHIHHGQGMHFSHEHTGRPAQPNPLSSRDGSGVRQPVHAVNATTHGPGEGDPGVTAAPAFRNAPHLRD